MMTTFLSAVVFAAGLLFPSTTGGPHPVAVAPVTNERPSVILLPPTKTPGWVAPLEPAVIDQPFHSPESPYGPGHRGIDLAGVVGQSVRAAGPGTVVVARPIAGRWIVSIQHPEGLSGLPSGRWRTTYEGVRPSVSVGAVVAAADQIGTLVGGGHAAGLHWGLKDGRVYRDPITLIRRSIILKPTSHQRLFASVR